MGSGEPVIFLNGIMMTTASWAFQTRALSPHFRCILHDFRGQLRSEKPPGPYSMSRHVDDLAQLLDELEIESAHIVGTSYGGEIGMMFAGKYPDQVKSLAVIACVSHVDEELAATIRQWADIARTAPAHLWDIALPWNYSPEFIAAQPIFIEAARVRIEALPADWFRALADLCDAFVTLDVRLDKIRCPTLVICAEKDRLKPLHRSREIAGGIAGAELVVIEGSGHAVVLENPAAVNSALLRFLGVISPSVR